MHDYILASKEIFDYYGIVNLMAKRVYLNYFATKYKFIYYILENSVENKKVQKIIYKGRQ